MPHGNQSHYGYNTYFTPEHFRWLQDEMNRAVGKHGYHNTPQHMPRYALRDRADSTALKVLVEEVGEVAKALTYDEGSRENLRAELIQTATMALAWATRIDAELTMSGSLDPNANLPLRDNSGKVIS